MQFGSREEVQADPVTTMTGHGTYVMNRWHDNWDVITPIFKFSMDVRVAFYTTYTDKLIMPIFSESRVFLRLFRKISA